MHLRRAASGDTDSTAWIVERFTSILLAHAAQRLGPGLRKHHDPEDVVADVWAIALPKLSELDLTPGRETGTVLKFLTTTLMYRVNNLVRKQIRRVQQRSRVSDAEEDHLSQLPRETTGIVTRAVRAERRYAVRTGLEKLDPVDRDVVLLRGIEQRSNQDVADSLSMKPDTVSHRYRRALMKLRAMVPLAILDDLAEEEEL